MGFQQDAEFHNIIFKMCWIKSKITQHGKRPSTGANVEMTEMFELSDKDFKAAMTKVLQQPILQSWNLQRNTKSEQRQKMYKGELLQILEWKNIITEIKTHWMGSMQQGDKILNLKMKP